MGTIGVTLEHDNLSGWTSIQILQIKVEKVQKRHSTVNVDKTDDDTTGQKPPRSLVINTNTPSLTEYVSFILTKTCSCRHQWNEGWGVGGVVVVVMGRVGVAMLSCQNTVQMNNCININVYEIPSLDSD